MTDTPYSQYSLFGCELQGQFILLHNTLNHAWELELLPFLKAWYPGHLIQYHLKFSPTSTSLFT